MAPVITVPINIKPWKSIANYVPPTPRGLDRYHKAKEKWKDSTPLYRHINPRPETWIPRPSIEINYKLPTAEDIKKGRQEYLAIVEEIKDRIPPEYYESWHDYYSRPITLNGEGPDRTGEIYGYSPNILTHPRFLEKSHVKYHALSEEKMFPEDEMLYKLQEVHQVKESLDIPEDDGVDCTERMWQRKRKEREIEFQAEKTLTEEKIRGAHWIDWDSINEEMIEVSKDDDIVWSPTIASEGQDTRATELDAIPKALIAAQKNDSKVKVDDVQRIDVLTTINKSNFRRDVFGFTVGISAWAMACSLQKFFTFWQQKWKGNDIIEEGDQFEALDEPGEKSEDLRKGNHVVREWHEENC